MQKKDVTVGGEYAYGSRASYSTPRKVTVVDLDAKRTTGRNSWDRKTVSGILVRFEDGKETIATGRDLLRTWADQVERNEAAARAADVQRERNTAAAKASADGLARIDEALALAGLMPIWQAVSSYAVPRREDRGRTSRPTVDDLKAVGFEFRAGERDLEVLTSISHFDRAAEKGSIVFADVVRLADAIGAGDR